MFSLLLFDNSVNCVVAGLRVSLFYFFVQADDGVVLPDRASLHLTAIEDADYKEDKIEC